MSTPSPTRDALVVGICNYEHLNDRENGKTNLDTVKKLTALAEQARKLADLLDMQGGFKVTRLPSTDPNGRVTLLDLEQAIRKLLYPPKESPTDTALLFFAGHGLVKEKEGFLATTEADGKNVYGFPLKKLCELLRDSPVKQLIVLLESCYSGELLTDFEETFKDDSHDICFITSARAHEEALADGLLTQALLELLDYTKYPEGYVTDKLLLERLQAKVILMEGWQRPQWKPEIQKRSIVLTNVAYTQKEPSDAVPYRGLDYFKTNTEDALFFNGRDQLIEELLNTVQEKRFLVVTGASGNGKSSVVRAGLLYQLPQKFPYRTLPVITPGRTPAASLRAIVDEAKQIIDQTQRVVLTVDQFEEIFASACSDSERQAFFELLFNIAEDISGKFSVIIVIRSDFLGKFLESSPDSVKNNLILVKSPEDNEVRQMIVEPAKRAGFSVEPHLVAEMVADFRKLEVGLPFLEFALDTLWKQGKTGRLLKYEDYENSGKIAGILENKANEYYQSFSAEEQIVVQRIFLELTDLKGKSDTRRPVLYDHLLALPYPPERIEKVIQQLVEQRLTTVDQPQDAPVVVNLAHETLIQHWSLFHDWLQEFREDATKQRRLEEDAQAYSDGKKSLLTGLDLGNAEAYLKVHQERVPLSETEIEFVKASMKVRRWQQRWKYAGIASLIAITVGLASYTYWYQYSYVLEHVTYCNTYAKRYGIMQCVGELTKEQVQGRAASYKFIRKGRKNPVWKVQAIRRTDEVVAKQSSTGNSAHDITTLTRRHKVGTYFNLAANRHNTSSLAQESQWEFVVDTSGRIVYEKAFDEQNMVWGLVYSPPLTGQPSRAHYVGAEGFPQPQQSTTAEFVEFEYSTDGYERSLRYFDREHQPQLGTANAFLIQHQVNEQGLVIEMTNFDVREQPTSEKFGVHKAISQYDAQGNMIEQAYFGTDGQPIWIADCGCHKWKSQFDVRGNRIETAFFGINGQPSLKEGVHKWISQYDVQGNEIESASFSTNGKPVLHAEGFHKMILHYNERGNETERAYFGIDGQPVIFKGKYHKLTSKQDVLGNDIEMAFFGTDGQPILNYVDCDGVHKIISQYDARGNVIKGAFFGTNGQPILDENGVHEVTPKFDAQGNKIENACFGLDGRPILNKYGIHRVTSQYDTLGNQIGEAYFDTFGNLTKKFNEHRKVIEEAYFDTEGKPIIGKDGHHKLTLRYDAQDNRIESSLFGTDKQSIKDEKGVYKLTAKFDARGKAIEGAYFGIDGQPILNDIGVHKITAQYDVRGNRIKWASFGIDGQPILFKDGYHKWTSQFDARDQEIETAYFGTDGQPILFKDGYHKWTSQFDARGHEIETAYFGTDGQPILRKEGSHKVTSQFDAQGNEIERAYFDTKGQLLKTQIWVNSVSPDSQAQKLGIQKGDIFTRYDGRAISERFRFAAQRKSESADGPAKELKILRDGKKLAFMVSPGNLGVELENKVIQK